MKNISTYFGAVALAVTLPMMTSCDGDGVSGIGSSETDELRAESFQRPSNGDIITFAPELNLRPDRFQIVFEGITSQADNGLTTFQYSKSGTYSFQISTTYNPDANIQTALDNTVGGDLGAPLNSRIRQLLDRDVPEYTTAELLEIINILNPSGANLELSPDGEKIYVVDNRVYTQNIASTAIEMKNGEVNGIYKLEVTGFEVGFRPATIGDVNRYRNIDFGDWIPFNNRIPVATTELERGLFDMQLINATN